MESSKLLTYFELSHSHMTRILDVMEVTQNTMNQSHLICKDAHVYMLLASVLLQDLTFWRQAADITSASNPQT